jgi:cell division protein FtsW (lipid II flippase)
LCIEPDGSIIVLYSASTHTPSNNTSTKENTVNKQLIIQLTVYFVVILGLLAIGVATFANNTNWVLIFVGTVLIVVGIGCALKVDDF